LLLCSGRRNWKARLAREKSLSVEEGWRMFSHAIHQFGKDAANCPEVDRWAIVLFEQNNFRCPIMSGDYVSS